MPPILPHPQHIDAAARALERFDRALAAVAQHDQRGTGQHAENAFQGMARNLVALRQVAQSFTNPATALGRAYQEQARGAALVTRAFQGHAQAARLAAQMTERQMGAMMSAASRQRAEQMRAEATFSRANQALVAKALYRDAYNVGPGGKSPGDTAARLKEERDTVRATGEMRTQRLFEAALRQSVEASLHQSRAGDTNRLAMGSLGEVTLHQQAERARLARATFARDMEGGSPGDDPNDVARRRGVSGATVRSVRARQESAFHLGSRRELEESNLLLERGRKLAEARARVFASPQGAAALKEQVRLQKELAAAQEREERARQWATKGGVGATLDGASKGLENLSANLRAAASVAQGAFAGITAGMLGLTSQADPFSGFATFTESLKGLAIEAGGNLLPVLDRLSLGIQSAERWFARIDPATRRWGVNLVVMAGGAALATVAVAKLVGGLSALAGMASFMWASPLAGIAALATAVGGAALAYKALGQSAKDAAGSVGSAPGGGPGGAGNGRALVPQPGDLDKIQDANVRAKIVGAAGKGSFDLANEMAAQIQAARDRAQKLQEAQGPKLPGIDQLERFLAETKAEYERARKGWGGYDPLAHGRGIGGGDAMAGASTRQLQAMQQWTHQNHARLVEAYYRAGSRNFQGYDTAGLLGGSPLKAQQRAAGAAVQAQLDQAAVLEALQKKLGLTDELSRAFRGPTAAILTDPLQLGERLQLAGLKGGDKEAENLEKQLRHLERTNDLLKEIKEASYEQLRNAAPRFRGH